MDSDFRSRYGPPAGQPAGRRPQPSPSLRQHPHLTDLRPQAQAQPMARPAQPTFQARPVPVAQPTPAPAPQQPAQPAAPVSTFKPHPKKYNLPLKKAAVYGLVVILLGGLVIHFFDRPHKPAASKYFPASVTPAEMTIPAYYPTGLPSGFKVSDAKLIKQNTLNYVVTNANKDQFYVTVQPQTPNFDFTAFQKKLTEPLVYDTSIGSDIIGQSGNSLVGSVKTASSSWILLNSTAVSDRQDMETIIKALHQVKL